MRLASSLAVLAAASAMLAGGASASTSTFVSNSSTTTFEGYLPFGGIISTGRPYQTYDIGTGGVWADPIAGSSWISFDPNTAPGGTNAQPMKHAPNGYYSYFTSFFAGADPTGFLTIMADDTVSVYLDEVLIQSGASGPYPKCAVTTPNCTSPLTIALTGLHAGQNHLDFIVHQANDYATGLDFAGTITSTPEPSSLLLLGTGLLGSAGAMIRRFRRA